MRAALFKISSTSVPSGLLRLHRRRSGEHDHPAENLDPQGSDRPESVRSTRTAITARLGVCGSKPSRRIEDFTSLTYIPTGRQPVPAVVSVTASLRDAQDAHPSVTC